MQFDQVEPHQRDVGLPSSWRREVASSGKSEFDLVHRQKRQRSENLGDLRREDRRMHHHFASRSISHDFTLSKHNATIGGSSDDFDIVCRNHYSVTIGSQLHQDFNEPLLCAIVKTAGGFVKKKKWWFRGQNN
jgi:hypothetical protein